MHNLCMELKFKAEFLKIWRSNLGSCDYQYIFELDYILKPASPFSMGLDN